MWTIRETQKFPAPSAAQPQAHFNQFHLTSQHPDATFSDTALYSKQYDLGASICVIQHLEQEPSGSPQPDRTHKPHNIQYRQSPVAVNTHTRVALQCVLIYIPWQWIIILIQIGFCLLCDQSTTFRETGPWSVHSQTRRRDVMSLDSHEVLVQILLLGIRGTSIGTK